MQVMGLYAGGVSHTFKTGDDVWFAPASGVVELTPGQITRANWGTNSRNVTVRTLDGRTFVRDALRVWHWEDRMRQRGA